MKKKAVRPIDPQPEKALITDFISAKLTDFGTSRSEADEDVTMVPRLMAISVKLQSQQPLTRNSPRKTSVGTPLYSAPELVRGEPFDEKVQTMFQMRRC